MSDLREVQAHTPWTPSGHARPKGKVTIKPIEICNKVDRVDSPYKVSLLKRKFTYHKKNVLNLENELFCSDGFIQRTSEVVVLLKSIIKVRKYTKIISVIVKLYSHNWDEEEIYNTVLPEISSLSEDIIEIKSLLNIIMETSLSCQLEAFVSIWQLASVAHTSIDELNEYFAWKRYKTNKESLKENISKISNNYWKSSSLNEENGKLLVKLPEPSHISNGQRDILILLSMFYRARINIEKSHGIIIIDEIFDYLDDANLITAQYYISQLINEFKRQGRSLYIMILTHLNPTFFNNYVFSNQNTIYLDHGLNFDSTQAMKKIISLRSDRNHPDELKDLISKHLVHYHNNNEIDFSDQLQGISGIRSSWGKPLKFQQFLNDEFNKYRSDCPYDPLAICAITRRAIEELAYSQISESSDCDDFFDTHKTSPKLNFASQRGAIIPEVHFLLKIIYDDGMHWRENRDNTIPIVSKLSNPIIKGMIIEVMDDLFALHE